MDKIRLFVAIEPGEAFERASERVFLSLSSRVGACAFARHPHVTLAFIGEVARASIGKAIDAVDTASRSAGPFELVSGPVGGFPESGRAKVVWLGFSSGESELISLARALRASLSARGVPFDPKPFSPHLTVARSRVGADASFLEPPEPPVRGIAAEIALFESRLGAGGAAHRALARFALSPSSRSPA
jgi:2'-5' RNA ligase